MTASSYSQQKDELLSILSEILKVKDLSISYREFFDRKKKKLQEDEFSISLIGEFQGGKSTTFDALCGGREISPRGNNIKTSACKIKVTNISDDRNEHAIITWKSNAEIVLTIKKILTGISPQDVGYKEEEKKLFNIEDYLDLSNPEHFVMVRNLVNEEWATVSSDDTDTRDILLIAEFILEFYDKTVQTRKVKECSLEDAVKFMTFPRNMASRFAKNGINNFDPSESLFAFVQSVNCYIHSETLERLGCTITDCPGLFASDYDTSIATQTIGESDATLYLLSGEKMMSKGDKKAISEIVRIKTEGLAKEDTSFQAALDNIFFAINQRKSDDETSFVEQDLTDINTFGFNKKELKTFNALLYYLTQFGNNYLENKLDNYSVNKFLDDGKNYGENIEEIWVKRVNKVLYSLDIMNFVDKLSKDSILFLSEKCKAVELFSEIETFIVNKKAYSILIDNGAKPIKGALNEIENELSNTEKAAAADVAAKAEEFAKAKKEFDDFREDVNDLLNNSFSDLTVIRPLIEKAYERFLRNPDVINKVSFHVTKDLIEYIGKGSTKWKGFKSLIGRGFSKKLQKETEEKIRTDITPFFGNSFRNYYTPVLTNWVIQLRKGEDGLFKKYFVPELESISSKIKNLWQLSVSSSPLLGSLTISTAPLEPENMEIAKLDYKKFISSSMTEHVSDLALTETLTDILHVVVAYCIGFIVTIVLDTILTFGMALIIGAIMELLYIVGALERKEIKSVSDFNKKQSELYEKIKSAIGNALANIDNQNKICFSDKEKSLIAIPNSIAQAYRDYYLIELSVKGKQLDENIKGWEKLYSGTKEQLQVIHRNAKKQRKEVIEPLRERVERFIEDISDAK